MLDNFDDFHRNDLNDFGGEVRGLGLGDDFHRQAGLVGGCDEYRVGGDLHGHSRHGLDSYSMALGVHTFVSEPLVGMPNDGHGGLGSGTQAKVGPDEIAGGEYPPVL